MRMNFGLPLRKYCRGDEKELITLRLPEVLSRSLEEAGKSHGWTPTDVLITALDQFLQSANSDLAGARKLKKEEFKKGKEKREVISLRLHLPLINELRAMAKKLKWNSTDVVLFAATHFIEKVTGRRVR